MILFHHSSSCVWRLKESMKAPLCFGSFALGKALRNSDLNSEINKLQKYNYKYNWFTGRENNLIRLFLCGCFIPVSIQQINIWPCVSTWENVHIVPHSSWFYIHFTSVSSICMYMYIVMYCKWLHHLVYVYIDTSQEIRKNANLSWRHCSE